MLRHIRHVRAKFGEGASGPLHRKDDLELCRDADCPCGSKVKITAV